MNDLMLNPAVHSPQEITWAAKQVREIAREKEIAPNTVLEVFEQWPRHWIAASCAKFQGWRFSGFGSAGAP